jgi:hypothetical protein
MTGPSSWSPEWRPTSMLLRSPTPERFLAEHLDAHATRLETSDQPDSSGFRWISHEELVRADGALLRERHEAVVAIEGAPAAAAAKYLAGWTGGALAESVGFVFAMASAGVLADESVRWRQHPDGWFDRVDVSGCRFVVTAGHPWAGRPDVRVLPDVDAVCRATVAGLAALLTPVLGVCRTLARVGWTSLWAEVADGLGMALTFTPRLREAPSAVGPLRLLLETPGAPWKKHPELWVGDPSGRPFVMGRKGGCCLAYTEEREPADPADPDLEDYHRAYLKRFPPSPGACDYCSTCSFRSHDDVEARQLFWLEHRGRTT